MSKLKGKKQTKNRNGCRSHMVISYDSIFCIFRYLRATWFHFDEFGPFIDFKIEKWKSWMEQMNMRWTLVETMCQVSR